jgi:hypothetical protein
MATDRLADAKKMILDVLRGVMTPENGPWVFDDDLLLLSVRYVEERDLAWLKSKVSNPAYDKKNRIEVGMNMTLEGRRELDEAMNAS